jgi:hypothetical protein
VAGISVEAGCELITSGLRALRRGWTPDRRFEDVSITVGNLATGNRRFPRKQAADFRSDAVGRGARG